MTTLPPLDAHRLWAATYDTTPNPLLALEARLLAPMLPVVEGRTVIDVASGTGRWARHLAAAGARVIAVDLCPEMLHRAPRPAVIADALKLPFGSAAADLVLCAFALGYMAHCLPELRRITRPGGTVIASDMHPDAIHRGWSRSFTSDSKVIHIRQRPYTLEELNAPGLRLVDFAESPFGAPEQPLFAEAGRIDLFDDACRTRAVFVAKWICE